MSEDSRKLLSNLNFCVLDLETTGGNLKYDKIIEIGLVRIENLEIVDTKDFLINPEIPIPQFIQKLTSIKESDTVNSPKIEEVIGEILDFIRDDIIVAHNTSFDIPFLNSILKRQKKPILKNKVLCTNVMTRYLIPEMMNSNLPHLCKVFGIEHQRAHRALYDAESTAKLLLSYLEIFIEKNIKKINQLYYPRNRFELDQIHLENKNDLEGILNKISSSDQFFSFTFKGEQGVIENFIPFHPQILSIETLKKFLDRPWKKVTIRIIGSFFQGLIQFKDYYLNIPKENREEILDVLSSTTTEDIDSKNGNFDFVISPHIVDDQFIIFSNKKLSYKNSLIFKYPGHERKLEQFIKSQSNKNSKRIKNYNNEDLQSVLQYIKSYASTHSDQLILLDKKELNFKNSKQFDEFIREKLSLKSDSSFPKFHF